MADDNSISTALDEYVDLGKNIAELQARMNQMQAHQQRLKDDINEWLEANGTKSITDVLYSHRATQYTEKRWMIFDADEFKAAIRESPYLLSLVIDNAVDNRIASRIAKDAPQLAEGIPGMGWMEQTKLRITRGKGKANADH